jgi:DDE superfamily endonuclease
MRNAPWPGRSNTRLYLPESWAKDPARRATAQVPTEVTFQTKAEIALGLLDQARSWNIKHACVVADADYGDNPAFLNGLEAHRERMVVGIRANFTVATARRTSVAGQRADELLAQVPRWQWQTIRWREGSTGWLRAKFTAIRCWRIDGEGARQVGWLIGQRPGRGQTGDVKYFWSNFAMETPLLVMVEYAHRRMWVEQFHEEKNCWVGINTRAACSPAFTATPPWSCSATASWCGGNGRNGCAKSAGAAPEATFPPRPDRRRTPLPAVHRQMADQLRELAIRESFIRQQLSLLI